MALVHILRILIYLVVFKVARTISNNNTDSGGNDESMMNLY